MADAPQPQAIAAPAADAPAPPTAGKRKRLFLILAIVVVTIGILYAVWYFLTQSGRVDTDNAYVGADSAQVTSLVSGAVTEVRVGGTQVVKKGDVLVVIDPADAKIDLATAEAALKQAQQKFGQTSAEASSARATVSSRGAEIAQARARLVDADATVARTRIDLDRRQRLVGSGAASAEELSNARAAYDSAVAARGLAQAGVTAAIATQNAAGQSATASEALVRGTTIYTAPDVATAPRL
jgi:membrane fusion protein (multidrug efflux system)